MAGDIPILPIMSPPDYAPRASSGGGGTPLFSMSASVGVDAYAFERGITSITQSMSTLNANITAMLTAIESIASASQTALNLLSTQATTTAQAVETAADGLSDSEIEDVVETLEELKEEYGEAAGTATEAETTMTSAATGASSAASAMADAVDEIGNSAQRSSFSFMDMAYAAYKAFGVVSDIAGTLWDFGAEMVDAAATYEMSMRTYATAFSGIEEEAAAAMEELSDETGLYSGLIRGNFASMQTQFRSAGYEQSDALGLSQRAMMLAADAAAHYGITLDEATRRVMSFLRGNQEGGESIGMFITQATREEWAQQMYGSAWKDLSEAQRQAALLQIAETTYASGGQTGAAARYSDSFMVAQQNLQQRWADIMGKLGTPVMEVWGEVLGGLFDVLETPEMEQVVDDFSEVLRGLLQNITDVLLKFIEWVASPEGQAAIEKVWGVIESILGWFGFGPKGETPDALTEESVEETYGGVPIDRESGVVNATAVAALAAQGNALMDALLAGRAWAFSGDADVEAMAYIDALDALAAISPDLVSALENIGPDSPFWGMLPTEQGQISGFDVQRYFGDTQESFESLVNMLPGAISSAISGISVQMNGVTVGHLVAPTVASDMARNAKFSQYTTAGTTA